MNEEIVYTIYTDAGSRGNPGHAACAAVLLGKGERLIDLNGKYLGIMTNNQAEYEGLILGLQLAKQHQCKYVDCVMDSQLVIRQMRGEYKIKDEHMRKKYLFVQSIVKEFVRVSFNHVERAHNASADKLVNIILDTRI